jgi:predicted  nucleic acid-binding Zn-ribbon protein
MSLWDDVRKRAGEVAESVSEKLSEVADQAGTEYNIMKIKRAIGLLESEINELEQRMGKRVYDLHRHGKIDDSELVSVCEEVDGLRKRIDENEEEIERIRQEAEEAEAAAAEDAPDPAPAQDSPEEKVPED